MKKIKEIQLLMQHLFSANRRHKAKILVREWWMGLPLPNRKGNNIQKELPPDPKPDSWRTHEVRDLDTDYFSNVPFPLIEDRILEDGKVHSEHEHTVQKVYGAISYTNDSTHRSVFTRTGERVELLSDTRALKKTYAPSQQRIPVSRVVSGVTASLYGTIACSEGNYAHWLIDAMSRLFMIERFHPLESIDQVLVPPLKYDFQWDSLAAFGFDRSRIIELKPLECLQFECFLASSWPRGRGSTICPGWVVDRYNETLLEKASAVESVAGRRVYISRRDAPNRMFINEEEVCSFLEKSGFDIVELTPLNLWQKIAVFRDADLIVSQTGAGLTNLMFCHPDIKFLELVDKRLVSPLYASLSVYKGGSHYVHYFTNDTALGRVNATVAKSSLDIDELAKSIELFKSAAA